MDYHFLSKTILFQGVTPEQTKAMLDCLETELKSYTKGATIYHAGDYVQSMGLVLSGSVHIESGDLWGNRNILSHISAGQIFAETYSCIPNEPLMVSVVAAEATSVLFLNTGRILKSCPSGCTFHSRLIRNLLAVMAQKNLNLSRRILHTSSKSIRGRLLSYLCFQATRQASNAFTIPFNRQQLADYLGVDRSAMSNELSKMKNEGILEVHKNYFELKKRDG